ESSARSAGWRTPSARATARGAQAQVSESSAPTAGSLEAGDARACRDAWRKGSSSAQAIISQQHALTLKVPKGGTMIPAAFDYHRPGTLDEALKLLKQHGEDAKVLSGGMSLLPMLKLRLASFGHLVDINRIPGLDYIKEDKGTLKIGAMTRQSALERSDVIKSKYPILADATPLIADPLVRNRGTVGGNVANGDPGNDQPAIMIALGATYVVQGDKERTVAANQFYKGLYDTALARSEILTEIRIPAPPPKSGGA